MSYIFQTNKVWQMWENNLILILSWEMLKGMCEKPRGNSHYFFTNSTQFLLPNHFLISEYYIFTQVLLQFNCSEAVTGSKAV